MTEECEGCPRLTGLVAAAAEEARAWRAASEKGRAGVGVVDEPSPAHVAAWVQGYLYRVENDPGRAAGEPAPDPYETVAYALYPHDTDEREAWGRGWSKAEFDASLGCLSPEHVMSSGAWLATLQHAVYRLLDERNRAIVRAERADADRILHHFQEHR